jgi:DNA replication initiation complex subunit (GINS family)
MASTFSYEDIYELLRGEKYSTDLQPLDQEILRKIHDYLKTKNKMLEKQSKDSEFFDKEKHEKLKTELENAERALKEFYEKRERKIINRAQFSSRTNFKLKDSTNMLESEEKLYNELIELLKKSLNEFQESYNNIKTIEPKDDCTKIKCKEAIPQMKCSDLKKYGPFEAESIVNIPNELAKVLITQNKAIEV